LGRGLQSELGQATALAPAPSGEASKPVEATRLFLAIHDHDHKLSIISATKLVPGKVEILD
jgi:hypothetical protein